MNNEITALLSSALKEEKKRGMALALKDKEFDLLPQIARLMAENEEEIAAIAKNTAISLCEECLRSTSKKITKPIQTLSVNLVKKFDHEFIKNAFKCLDDKKPEVIIEGLMILKFFIDSKMAKNIIFKLIKHPDDRVRATTALHMGMVASKSNVEILIRFLNDVNERVKANTIEVLETLNNKNLVRTFARFRKDPNNRIRANAIKALFNLGEKKVYNDLKEMLQSPEPLMRTSAVWVIGEIGGFDKKFLELLKIVINDNNELIKNNLLIAKKKIGDIPELAFLDATLNLEKRDELKEKIIKTSKIDVRKLEKVNYLLMKIHGSIVSNSIISLRLNFQGQDIAKHRYIVLDLSYVDAIDSTGTTTIVNFSKQLEKADKSLYIFGCSPKVKEIFLLLKVDIMLNIFENEEQVKTFISL